MWLCLNKLSTCSTNALYVPVFIMSYMYPHFQEYIISIYEILRQRKDSILLKHGSLNSHVHFDRQFDNRNKGTINSNSDITLIAIILP